MLQRHSSGGGDVTGCRYQGDDRFDSLLWSCWEGKIFRSLLLQISRDGLLPKSGRSVPMPVKSTWFWHIASGICGLHSTDTVRSCHITLWRLVGALIFCVDTSPANNIQCCFSCLVLRTHSMLIAGIYAVCLVSGRYWHRDLLLCTSWLGYSAKNQNRIKAAISGKHYFCCGYCLG